MLYRYVFCYTVRYSHRRPFYGLGILCTYSTYIAMVVMYVTKHIAIVLLLSMYCKFRWKHFFVRKNLFEVYLTQCKKKTINMIWPSFFGSMRNICLFHYQILPYSYYSKVTIISTLETFFEIFVGWKRKCSRVFSVYRWKKN